MTGGTLQDQAIWAAAATAALAFWGEWLHARRTARIGRLAFGPGGRPRTWTRLAPALRVAALAGLAWSLVALLAYDKRVRDRSNRDVPARHLVVLLDVSPSMLLTDAGPGADLTRMARAREVVKSVLDRAPGEHLRFTVAGFYTEARMMLRESVDRELALHFTGGVPFHITYEPGRTDLLKSFNQAGEMIKGWPRKSATLLVISDGDSVPPAGLNPLPPCVDSVIFAGVGDSVRGTAIDGHLSRQDTGALAQLARRLGGRYFDCNTRQLPSEALVSLAGGGAGSSKWSADRRLVALTLAATCATLLCALPMLLDFLGSAWRPRAALSEPRTNPGL